MRCRLDRFLLAYLVGSPRIGRYGEDNHRNRAMTLRRGRFAFELWRLRNLDVFDTGLAKAAVICGKTGPNGTPCVRTFAHAYKAERTTPGGNSRGRF